MDGLGDQVGYQMVWHDMHLLMVMRMNLRFKVTHIHVAIRFIGKILYRCVSHNNKIQLGYDGKLFFNNLISQTKPRAGVAPQQISLAAASHLAWQVRLACQNLFSNGKLLPPPENDSLHLHHVHQPVLAQAHPLWSRS